MFFLTPKKKMGRPTDNPKRHEIKARIDDDTYKILNDYCEKQGKTKAEGIRDGIRKLGCNIEEKKLDFSASVSYAINDPISEVVLLGSKKMGRPTDNPKDISLKVHLDQGTAQKLEECTQALGVSKAEVIRRGVHKVHDDLKEK